MRSTATHVYFHGGPLSNWAITPFVVENIRAHLARYAPAVLEKMDARADRPQAAPVRFNCGEQWMMAMKAWFFGDDAALKKIMVSNQPVEQKAIGRSVRGLKGGKWDAEDKALWDSVCDDLVFAGLVLKFEQDARARRTLASSGNRVLVEGSPRDRIWGVGIDWRDARIEDERNWLGTNRLGKALGRTRDVLGLSDGGEVRRAQTL